MKSWKATWTVLAMSVILIGVGVVGCAKNTEGVYELTPRGEQVVNAVATHGGTAAQVLPLFAGLWPPLAGIGGVLGLIFGVVKGRQNNTINAVGSGLAVGIDQWKKDRPDDWLKLEAYLVKRLGPNAKAVIDGWRGLPPKT